jgi:phage terminase small subunit
VKGGSNRKSDAQKAMEGTFRPDRARATPEPQALTEWPKAPADFTEAEAAAWDRLGTFLLKLGTVCEADLLQAERVAQVGAMVDQARKNVTLKTTTLASLMRLEEKLRASFGLTPASRRGVDRLPVEEEPDENDPLAGIE